MSRVRRFQDGGIGTGTGNQDLWEVYPRPQSFAINFRHLPPGTAGYLKETVLTVSALFFSLATEQASWGQVIYSHTI